MFGVSAKNTHITEDVSIYIQNVSELGVDNTEINFFHTKWNFAVERIEDDLSVFLEPIGEVHYDVGITIQLLQSDESASPHEEHFRGNFQHGTPCKLGNSKFISWHELMKDNKYVENNITSFKIKFTLTRISNISMLLNRGGN